MLTLITATLSGCATSEDGPSDATKSIVEIPIEVTHRQMSGPQTMTITDGSGAFVALITLPPTFGDAQAAYVTAVINGWQRIRFLIDTGATITTIYAPAGWFAQQGVVPDGFATVAGGGQVPTKTLTLESLQIGDFVVPSFRATVMEHVDFPRREFDGVLGTDFLFQKRVTIDPNNRRMIITDH